MLLRPGHSRWTNCRPSTPAAALLSSTPALPAGIQASAAVVQRAAAGDAPVYGVNTGFGKLASTRISSEDLATLQLNLIRSHSVGVGEPLAPAVVRLMLALKAASLARGHSGVRPVVIDTLLAVHNAGLVPCVPSQGSVGASGDLAPLAHMTLALMGEGEFVVDGAPRAGGRGAACRRHRAAALQAKEGLALINGTQTSTALALHALLQLRAGAGGGAGGRRADGRRRARQRRPLRPAHPCAARPARPDRRGAVLPRLLAGSADPRSHLDGDDRVQDPYCLRCQPQVVGACLDQLRHAALVLLREANAVTDNPLVFADDGAMISGGNFHAEPVALAADAMALRHRRGRRDRRAPHRHADRQPACRACRPS
jgi:histidine ammonia-lyase